MPRKAVSEGYHAQATETIVFALVTGWITFLVKTMEQSQNTEEKAPLFAEKQLQTIMISHALLALCILGLLAVLSSILKPLALPKSIQASSRQERDAGLVVGCVLPPVVLLSRLLVEIYHEKKFSAFTFFYAWTSISIGISVLLKIAVFKSMTSFSLGILVDAILLPSVFTLLTPVESELRFLLATGARVIVAAVLAGGFKLLPRSFTLGEALLVAQGVGFCFYDLVMTTVKNLSKSCVINLPRIFLHSWHIFDVDRLDYELAVQVGILGSLMVCVALIPLLRIHGTPSPAMISQPLPVRESVKFLCITGMVVVGVVYPWSCFLLQTWNPFAWLLHFLMESSSNHLISFPPRFGLIGYWIFCLLVLIRFITFTSKRYALRNIVARKLFHVLVVLMLGPASLIDIPMLSLSYGVSLSIFFLVECVRALGLPPFGQSIAKFMRSFIDHREAGCVILTHSYLLLGCALPLWLAPSSSRPPVLSVNAGILALGIGDAMGAVVGSNFGKRKIFGNKTLEGSLAVFISMLLGSLPLHDYHTRFFIDGEYFQLIFLTAATMLTCVLEAATAQIDNLVLPLFFFALCNLFFPFHRKNMTDQQLARDLDRLHTVIDSVSNSALKTYMKAALRAFEVSTSPTKLAPSNSSVKTETEKSDAVLVKLREKDVIVKKPRDALFVAVHALLLEAGFQLLLTEGSEFALPKNWDATSANGLFSAKYLHPNDASIKFLLQGLFVGSLFKVYISDEKDHMHAIELSVEKFVAPSDSTGSIAAADVLHNMKTLRETITPFVEDVLLVKEKRTTCKPVIDSPGIVFPSKRDDDQGNNDAELPARLPSVGKGDAFLGGGNPDMLVGPDHPLFGHRGDPSAGPVPGARFDPFGPSIDPLGPSGVRLPPSRGPAPTMPFGGPGPDHLRMPRDDDMDPGFDFNGRGGGGFSQPFGSNHSFF